MPSPVFIPRTKVHFLTLFCTLITFHLSFVTLHPLAIDGSRLGNSSNFNKTSAQSFLRVRRLSDPEEDEFRIDNPWNDEDNQILPDESSLLPFVESGECKQGRIYKIESGEDLRTFREELECIFFSGLSPSKIPLGPLYGSVLSILEMTEFDEIVDLVWWGKLINEVQCPGSAPRFSPVYIGWNDILHHSIVPFVASLSPIKERLAPGEIADGKSNLIIDYTQDFSKLCPNFEALQNDQGMNIPERNVFPLNQIVDALRLVGRQRDGGSILLGKTYLRNSALRWSSTVIYFYFINYDSRVNPEFGRGQELPPLEQSFTYRIPGIGGNFWQI